MGELPVVGVAFEDPNMSAREEAVRGVSLRTRATGWGRMKRNKAARRIKAAAKSIREPREKGLVRGNGWGVEVRAAPGVGIGVAMVAAGVGWTSTR